ncbi:MAG: hypothetical protein H7Y86_13520 [Rhizobacter sp.]|nr:hypothetical protein [Ferruginibacter sp.]
MKKITLFSCFFLGSFSYSFSQNVGIGTGTPQQKLDVNGAIKIGGTSTNAPGSIRYNSGQIEAGDGVSWSPLAVPNSAIVLSETNNNAVLENAGYQLIGKTLVNYAGFGASGSWIPIPIIDIPTVNALTNPTGVFTGNKYIVWGGYHNGAGPSSGYKNLGYMFDSTTNTWTNTTTTGAPVGRFNHFAGRIPGNRMLVFGGRSVNISGGNVPYNDGAIFTPATNSWSPLFSTVNAPPVATIGSARYALDTIANKLYVYSNYLSTPYFNCYNINTNTWTALSTVNAPTGIAGGASVWLGNSNKWMFWSGNPVTAQIDGRIYDAASNTWTTMTAPPAFVQAVSAPALVWSGTHVIAYGGALNGTDNYSNQAVKYNPSSNTWTDLATLNKPSPRFLHAVKYGGDKLFIWGGFEKQLDLTYIKVNSGAYYNLLNDTWNEIPSGTGTPDRRAGSLIEWTGHEMYIWGGSSEAGRTGALSGGRYAPDLSTGGGFGGFQSKTYYLYQKM